MPLLFFLEYYYFNEFIFFILHGYLTTLLFSVDGGGDGEMRPWIRHRLLDIRLTVGENLGKNITR